MSLRYLGPVPVTEHFDPSFSWTSEDVAGIRGASISGELPWSKAQQLSELVNNGARRITIGSHSGVLEYVHLDDVMLRDFQGFYLFRSFDVDADHASSLNGVDGPVPFSVDAAYLGDITHREVVVVRSARPRANDHGLDPSSIVANPFSDDAEQFPVSPGGESFTREYDPADYTPGGGTSADMLLHTGSVNGTDALARVVPLSLPTSVTTPTWVSQRSGDVRGWDRREGRHVDGAGHSFKETTDLLVSNGILRFWVGNRGLIPFLNIQVRKGGAWREVGTLLLASPVGSDKLLGARLKTLTPEAAVLILSVRNVGDVTVRLQRGWRSVVVLNAPYVGWAGAPPAKAITGVTNGTGAFGNGLVVDSGDWARLWWPPELMSWAVALRWLPTAASATQVDSGLVNLRDASGTEVMTLRYYAADKTIRWAKGGSSLSTAPLTFSAGQSVWGAMRQTATGRTLSVRTATLAHGSDAVMDLTELETIGIGRVSEALSSGAYGAGAYGMGPYGATTASGGVYANGVIDNVQLFDALSDAEAAALSTSATALGSLPNEGRMVWYAPFDAKPIPLGSLLTDGLMYETTTDGGSTRAPDVTGLTKGLAVLRDVGAKAPGLALEGADEVLAFVATGSANDDLDDHHNQFAAVYEQEVRVRA